VSFKNQFAARAKLITNMLAEARPSRLPQLLSNAILNWEICVYTPEFSQFCGFAPNFNQNAKYAL
jgi:hypothetical protein